MKALLVLMVDVALIVALVVLAEVSVVDDEHFSDGTAGGGGR